MQIEPNQFDGLLAFKTRDKFSLTAWNERGLNPRSCKLSQHLTDLLDTYTDKLISAINNSASKRQLKTILKSGLFSFNEFDCDTEEKEFICDLFYELAAITKVDFKDNISLWLYGAVTPNQPREVLETLMQPCSNCGTQLESYIIQKEKGIPDSSWFIIKCLNCNELNLLSPGPDVKEIKFGDYQWIQTLNKNDYSYDQALLLIKQISLSGKQ